MAADRRNKDVIRLIMAFDFVEIFAVRVALERVARRQQMAQLLDRAGFVVSGVFDSRSFFDLQHYNSNLFGHCRIATDSGYSGYDYKMNECPKSCLNKTLKIANVSESQNHQWDCQLPAICTQRLL